MRLWIQFLVLVAVVVILAEQNGVEAKKNKQKHGRSQEKSLAKSGQNKENSRKVRDISNSKEKYNKKEEVKYTKQTKKNTKNDNKEKKNNEFVNKKSIKQDKKQGNKATEYVDKKIDNKKAKNKNEKNVKTEEIVKEEAVEEEGIEEIAPEETEIATNEGGEEMEVVEEPSVKGTEDKLVQCNKKTDSVETNLTETCQKYKSEKNLKVVEKVHSSSVASGACDACKS